MVWAWQGREYGEWERIAELWAVFAEANRDHNKRTRPFSAQDLFRRPGAKRAMRGAPLTGDMLRLMRPMFSRKVSP